MSRPSDLSGDSRRASTAEFEVTPEELAPVAEYARQNQIAVLVVLFTDIKGSTELTEVHGEEFSRDLRHQHDVLLRTTFERDNGGRLIKKIGDALMYVFAAPSDAVARAIEVQQRLSEYNSTRPTDPPLLVRIGMHMGQVLVERDIDVDVFGRHVNRAARVESLADGGQVLVTHAVYDSARGFLSKESISWYDHGDYLLKGIPEPTRIVEACPKGVTSRRPAGHRISGSRWWTLAVAIVIGVAMLGTVWTMSLKPPLPTIEVSVRRGDSLVLPLAEAAPLASGDEIRVRAEFHGPVHAAIVLVDENGIPEILTTSGDKRVTSLAYPVELNSWVEVTGRRGTEMLIALESSQPIVNTPAGLTQQKWELPETLTSDETWWITPDGIKIQHEGKSKTEKGLGKIEKLETHDLRFRIDQVRQLLTDQSFRFQAVAYPHQ